MSPASKFSTDVGLAVVAGSALLGTMLAFLIPSTVPPPIQVAFVGNSMLFVNDMPRFLQALSQGAIRQDSCLHGSLHFDSLLRKGNGMYHKWRTKNALVTEDIWDFGACTVEQLLLGYDDNLGLENMNGYYKDDGKNPCFQSNAYYRYRHYLPTLSTWDFVVMNDQSKAPAIEEKRENSLQALESYYVDYLLQNGATPILMATHGYQATSQNTTALMGDVANFTSNVYEGYRQYAKLLTQHLPETQTPRIAPTGLAFLYIYEDDMDMWKKLFFVDGFHPSPHGSYLMGCVLYATIYGEMPYQTTAFLGERLWKRARKMQVGSQYHMPYPTTQEMKYLFSVARKVALQGVLPETLILYDDNMDDSSSSSGT